jgi:hypothetical protein
MTDTDKLRALASAATPGPWHRGHQPDGRDAVEYFTEIYSYGTPGRVWLACVPVEGKDINDEAKFTAITGNGPTSEANASFIAAASPSVVLGLLDRIEELEGRLAIRTLSQVAELQDQLSTTKDALAEACDIARELFAIGIDLVNGRAPSMSTSEMIRSRADRLAAIRAQVEGGK